METMYATIAEPKLKNAVTVEQRWFHSMAEGIIFIRLLCIWMRLNRR